MAYGKDEGVLETVNAFRRADAIFAKETPRLGGKSRAPAFVHEYTPSVSCVDTVRLVPGDYAQESVVLQVNAMGQQVPAVVTDSLPFIEYTKHYDGHFKRGCICSAGPFRDRNHRKPCHGCDIYFATAARNEEGHYGSERMSRQSTYAFSVWDYGVYHNAPQTDQRGAVKMGPQNKPYMQWQKCIVQGCQGCRAGNLETKQGIMRAWPLNYTQYAVLKQADKQIGNSCLRCFAQNSIRGVNWITSCCRSVVIDMQTTSLTAEDINKLTRTDYTCQVCKTAALLSETYVCASCEQRGQFGVRASLFDVDLNVMTVLGASNGKGQQKNLQVCGWSPPNIIQESWKSFLKPMDLLAIYAPDSLEFQAKLFGVQPTGPGPQPGMPPQTQQPAPVQGYAAPPQAPQQWGSPPPQQQPQWNNPPTQQQPQYAPQQQMPAFAPQQPITQAPQPGSFGQPGFPQGFGPPGTATGQPPAIPYGPRR